MATRRYIDLLGERAVAALVAGHKRSWDSFIDTTVPLVRTVVHRALAAPDDAILADAVQNVFVQLRADDCRLLRTFDPARARLSTWLAVIAWSLSASAPCRSPAPRCRGAG
jgi:RNA polymerase sigma-70 factor (ECF subfamily)